MITNKDNQNQAHDKVILNKKEDCPFVIRASKFNHKISLFQRQETSNFLIRKNALKVIRGQTNGQTNGRTNGWTNGRTYQHSEL
jgi:hypothetical protein